MDSQQNNQVPIDEPVPTVVASPRIPFGGENVPADAEPPRMPPGMAELIDLPRARRPLRADEARAPRG